MRKEEKYIVPVVCLALLLVMMHSNVTWAFKQKTEKNEIEKLEFMKDELYISQTNIPVEQVLNQLAKKAIWQEFLSQHKSAFAYIDPRSARPSSIISSILLLPGTGDKNHISFGDLSMKVGHEVSKIGTNEVNQLVLDFINDHAEILGINPQELGEIRVGNPTDYLWQAFIKREVDGIPVRDSYLSIAINHGNIVLWGVEKWGDINVKTEPLLSKEEALKRGFALIGQQTEKDSFVIAIHLELVPVAPSGWTGAIGSGYRYRLVWAYTFQRKGFPNTWETLVDANSGEVLSFQDTNQYALKKIVGSLYPVSDDGCCPEGCAVKTGMPYFNTGAPNGSDPYTDINGLYNYISGTACTTMDSKYINLGIDNCGTNTVCSATGDIDLDGTNGQHDCTVPGGYPAGDTFASRTCVAESTFINREARSWVNYAWLDCSGIACATCNVNINATCNCYWYGNSINFYRSGGGCRNTGEIAAIFDHEWGHGLDNYDTNGVMSNPGEVIGDVVSQLRLHQSCIGKGFFWSLNRGCGAWICPTNSLSTGYNCSGYGDCCQGCTGIRDSDYAKHASGNPHTPANFICTYCSAGAGPCGKEVHCEDSPAAEAVWDIAAKDLESAPFNYDRQTAFTLAERIMYIGSGNVTQWYACTCPGNSNGCGATNGYMQFITADDDNGNLSDGTPHMTAIYNAFNRHGIACDTPPPADNGCTSGPSTAPVLTATASSNSVQLSWTSVPGAASYYVLKSTSSLGCDIGKAIIAAVSDTAYLDQALDCNQNNYMVMAVGSDPACLSPASNCVSVTPPYSAPSNISATASAPNEVTISWDPVGGASGYNVYRKYTLCSVQTVEKIANNISTNSYVDSPVQAD